MWDQPEQYKDSYRFRVTWQKSNSVSETQYNIPGLIPGSSYNITVTTETSDGTGGDPTLVSNCTSMVITDRLFTY